MKIIDCQFAKFRDVPEGGVFLATRGTYRYLKIVERGDANCVSLVNGCHGYMFRNDEVVYYPNAVVILEPNEGMFK